MDHERCVDAARFALSFAAHQGYRGVSRTAGRMPRRTSGAGCKRLPTPPLHLFWTGTQAISPWPCNRSCVRPWGAFLRRFRGAPHEPMRVLYRRVFFCILRPSGGRRSGLDQNLPVREFGRIVRQTAQPASRTLLGGATSPILHFGTSPSGRNFPRRAFWRHGVCVIVVGFLQSL